MNDIEKITQAFYDVKELGWIKSNRRHNTGIGKTFEDYVGVVENNLDEPDLFGFEIKSHRETATSPISLVTKAPNLPNRNKNNKYLLDKFGQPNERFIQENINAVVPKKLFASIFANKKSCVYSKYMVYLKNDRVNRELKIVFEDENGQIIDDNVGYTYDVLEESFSKKLSNLLYVTAEVKKVNNDEYFNYTNAEIHTNVSFDKFLDLLDNGTIQYDIRMGCYESGKNYGKFHDHGSCIRISEKDLHLLYADIEQI